ncbi:MAG: SCO family protein [Planctomycetota bacterium]|nr:SCO family protein [Planctomycetota bacterium]
MFDRSGIFLSVWLLAISSSVGFAAQVNSWTPPDEVSDYTTIQKNYDGVLPLETRFTDDEGYRVSLGDLFKGRPVVISLNYSDCPMLCDIQLREFVVSASQLEMVPGVDYEVVSISLDPNETTQRAKDTKAKYVALSGKSQTAEGWHVLTGDRTSIDAVANALGISYKYIKDSKEYAHPVVFTVCTGDGRISQYLQGVGLPKSTLRLALVDASEGNLGSPTDWFVLSCFVYDPDSNSYSPLASKIMKWAGGFTVFVLLVCLVPFWLRRSPAGKTSDSGEPAPVIS